MYGWVKGYAIIGGAWYLVQSEARGAYRGVAYKKRVSKYVANFGPNVDLLE